MSKRILSMMGKRSKSVTLSDSYNTVFDSEQSSQQEDEKVTEKIESKRLFAKTYDQFIKQNSKQFISISNIEKQPNFVSTILAEQGDDQMLQFRRSIERKQAIVIKDKRIVNSFCVSKMGIRNYDNMQNQDTILVDDYKSGKIKIFGIFDGHGQYGKQISESASEYFKKKLKNGFQEFMTPPYQCSVEQIVKKTLVKTNEYLISVKSKKSCSSGTCALILIIHDMKMYYFSIGNSRAVLFKKHQNKLCPFQITLDQTLARFDERLRVINAGAVIKPLRTNIDKQLGPERLWFEGKKYPGIYITRTLGMSNASKLGIISQPELSILTIRQEFQFVLMGSDGLWDVITNLQALQILEFYANSKQLRLGISKLINQAIERWSKNRQLMDDISIIVVQFS